MALATRRRDGFAQEDMDGHPLIGAWEWHSFPDKPNASTLLAVFQAGGTYIEWDPGIGVGIGAWAASGERTANLTIKFMDTDFDPSVFSAGILTFWIAIEIDETGNAYTASGIACQTGQSPRLRAL